MTGIGDVNASKIAASFELGRRSVIRETLMDDPIHYPETLARTLIVKYGHHVQERLGAVYLDAKHRVIIFHNHPSGSPEPSGDDLLFTRKLVEAGKVLGIDVVDHLIQARIDLSRSRNGAQFERGRSRLAPPFSKASISCKCLALAFNSSRSLDFGICHLPLGTHTGDPHH